ncbi:MAG: ABC transporter permease [Bacillota bacterium]
MSTRTIKKLGMVRRTSRIIPLSGLWGDLPAPAGLTVLGIVAGVLASLPAILVVSTALNGSFQLLQRLLQTKILYLLLNTLALMVAVTTVTVVISLLLAFLIVRTDLPGKRVWHHLMAVPLAIPPYIGSFAYISLIGPTGTATNLLKQTFGLSMEQIPSIYSFGGATVILSLFTFPYVYLLVNPALSSLAGRWEEVGRSCGLSAGEVFLKVTLPLLKPSIGAGSLLVGLYVLSDFGAVSMLRFDTFSSAIYLQLIGRYDKVAASVLASVLVALTLFLIIFEQRIKGKSKYYQFGSSYTRPQEIQLGAWRYPALGLVLLVLLAGVATPLAMLTYWAVIGITKGAINGDFWSYTFHSLLSGAMAATTAMFLALVIAYLNNRHRGPLSHLVNGMAHAGYALPGVVVALGFILVANNYIPALYGTLWVLLAAYVVRFLPQGIQAGNSGMAQVPPQLEEAGRLAGYSYWGSFIKVTVPLVHKGLLAGWALIFLNILKELPVTLLLRPVGFDTLPVRVWIEASEGFFYLGAPGALLLVMVSMIPLVLLTENGGRKDHVSGS